MDGDLSCSWMWDVQSIQASSEGVAASPDLSPFGRRHRSRNAAPAPLCLVYIAPTSLLGIQPASLRCAANIEGHELFCS